MDGIDQDAKPKTEAELMCELLWEEYTSLVQKVIDDPRLLDDRKHLAKEEEARQAFKDAFKKMCGGN